MIAAREDHLVINARETSEELEQALHRVCSTHRQCLRAKKLLTQRQKVWRSPLGDPPGDNSPQMLSQATVEAAHLWEHPTHGPAPLTRCTPQEMLRRERLWRAASEGLAEAARRRRGVFSEIK